MTAWDDAAARIASLTRDEFGEQLRRAPRADQDELLRMRLRWCIDEFAELVIRPIVERQGVWYPNNPLNDELINLPAGRFYDRPKGANGLHLVWGPRGSAKTTSSKVRAFHALVYGLEAGIITIAAGDTAASGWTHTLESWSSDPSPMLRRLWPGFAIRGSNEMRVATAPGRAPVALHARGWTSQQIRGINHDLARPTLIVLDDIESDATTSSAPVRDKAQEKLLTQVLGLLPMEGGGQVWWSATPVHHDCISARAFNRADGLGAWSLIRHRAVRAWPRRTDLWERCRAIFFDHDLGTPEARAAAALAFYTEHRVEMDEGADVLDPHRLPIFACYAKRWSMGDAAFWREYLTEARARTTSHFDSSTWKRCRWSPDRRWVITSSKRPLRVSDLHRVGHWDPSDGGDPGALAIGAREPNGLTLVLRVLVMERTRKSEQIRQVVAACRELGVSVLQYESNSLDDVGVRALADEVKRTGGGIRLVSKHSSENKNARISDLEVPCSQGAIEFADDIGQYTLAQADDWNPARNDNVDDVLDALQRLHELVSAKTPGMAR